MTRAEHMAWAKQRALEYVERGELSSAIASMISDLGKHPETARSVAIGAMIAPLHSVNPGDSSHVYAVRKCDRGLQLMRKSIVRPSTVFVPRFCCHATDQSFNRVSFYFPTPEDAEKFYIAISQSIRLGLPLTWEPEPSA